MVLFILFFSKKKFFEINCGGNDFFEDFYFFLLWKWDIECIGEFVVVNLIDLMFK